MWFYASLLSKFIGRNRMESVAGMKWNHRPESRGISGRNALEYATAMIFPDKYQFVIILLLNKCFTRLLPGYNIT